MIRSILVTCLLTCTVTGTVAQEYPKSTVTDKPKSADAFLETLEQLQKQAEEAAQRLAGRDPGKQTRKVQEDSLKSIDALIKQLQQPPESASNNPSTPMNGKDGKNNDTPSGNTSSGSTSSSRLSHKDRLSTPNAKSGSGKDQRSVSRPTGKTGPGQDAKGSPTDPRMLQPRMIENRKDVWGHLPEKMRQEMDLYYREQFMPRYRELLKQYYSSLAETSRSTPGRN